MPETPYAIITMGVSGSGKTTVAEALAKRLGWSFVDGDAFHPPANVEKMRGGTPLTDDDRWPWLKAIAAEIARHRAANDRVVVACSALKRAYRDVLVDGHSDVLIVYMKGSRELIMRRLAPRQGHYFPASLLDSQFAALEEPDARERALTIDIDQDINAIIDEIVVALRTSCSS
jgi:carbohydrate kinase (thermoresistant glucokinase family)